MFFLLFILFEFLIGLVLIYGASGRNKKFWTFIQVGATSSLARICPTYDEFSDLLQHFVFIDHVCRYLGLQVTYLSACEL